MQDQPTLTDRHVTVHSLRRTLTAQRRLSRATLTVAVGLMVGSSIGLMNRPVTAAPPNPAPTTVAFTQNDSGRTFQVGVGALIDGQLQGSPSVLWSPIVNSSPGILRPQPRGILSRLGSQLFRGVAVTPGRAVLTSSAWPECFSGSLCTEFFRTFTLTIDVVGPAPPPGKITFTEADNGRSVQVKVGTEMDGYLQGSQFQRWSPIADSNPAVVRAVTTGILPTVGSQLFRGVAASPGRAVLTSSVGPFCPPGALCPRFVRGFAVTVDVVP